VLVTQTHPAHFLGVAVGVFGTGKRVTKWGSLQDTLAMDAAIHPLEKSPLGAD
jgi:hypothetical protein